MLFRDAVQMSLRIPILKNFPSDWTAKEILRRREKKANASEDEDAEMDDISVSSYTFHDGYAQLTRTSVFV